MLIKGSIKMNALANQLNKVLESGNSHIMDMLSNVGKALFFPKGILSQSAEAKEKAYRINATIGIAKEEGKTMKFDTVMDNIRGIKPSEALTYAPSFGIPPLRKKWQDQLYKKNPSLDGKPISLPVVTCGITHGVSIFADVWMDPDDVLILPDMMWGNYNMIFSVRKGVRISQYSLFSNSGGFNVQAFAETVKKEAASNKKICVLLNFPQNPTGYTITEKEADQIVDILHQTAKGGTNVIVVSDDAYFGLFYDDEILKESLFARLSNLHPRLLAVKLDGGTKENFVWGLRIGFITYGGVFEGDVPAVFDALERKTAGCVRGNISNASHLSQSLLLKSMQDDRNPPEIKDKFEILKKRAVRVKSVLEDPKYKDAWEPYPFNSGYFMCIRLKTVDAETLRLHLLEKYGVGLIALGASNLRVAFSCMEEEDVTELFDTVLKGVKDLESL